MKLSTTICAIALACTLPVTAGAGTKKVLNIGHVAAAKKDQKLAEHPKLSRALHKAKGAEAFWNPVKIKVHVPQTAF